MIALRRETHPPPGGARVGRRPVYAIGDVHGCYHLLRALLEEIARDAAERQPGTTPLVILCGDYVDRGPASAPVVAAAFHPALAPVGVLLGTIGYATGTYLAYIVGITLRALAA
mgnify:CR=1 FL=1